MRHRILDFLRKSFPDKSGEGIQVEYRLLCSGTLHRELIGDWTRSDAARLLFLEEDFTLLIGGPRVGSYPQELVLRFACPFVTETYGPNSSTYPPDTEIAADLGALLTLFSRRLVVVVGKVRQIQPGATEVPPQLRDQPVNIYGEPSAPIYWPPRQDFVIRTPERQPDGTWNVREKIRSHQSEPVAIAPQILGEFLRKLAQRDDDLAGRIVAAARRYQEGMRFMPQDVGLAYQYLISALETMSNFGRGWYVALPRR